MTEPHTPIDQALDLFVFAPLGLLLEARRLLPELAERGHQQVNTQVTMARMIGRFAVEQGQVQAGKRLERVQKQASGTLADLGLGDRVERGATKNGTSPAPTPSPTPTTTSPSANPTATVVPTGASTASSSASPEAAVVAGDDAALAVPDYDSLAASQVIPRLAGLSPSELEAVRAHEVARRARKTILNRIAQLQAG